MTATYIADNTVRLVEGFYEGFPGLKSKGFPEDSNTWVHLLSVTHSNTGSNYALQLAGGFFDNEHFYIRKTNNNGLAPWREIYHTGTKSFLFGEGTGKGQVRLDSSYDVPTGQGRITVLRGEDSNDTYADILMYKDTRSKAPGAGGGTVSSMLKLEQRVGPAETFQWPLVTSLKVEGAGSGQHVAMYAQAFKSAEAPTFGACIETRSTLPNQVTGLVGLELDIFGRGGDANNSRVGIDLVYGGSEPYEAGDNVVSTGLRISPMHGQSTWVPGTTNGFETSATTGRAILKKGIEIGGIVQTGIDLSHMDTSVSDTGILMANNQFLKWDQGGTIGFLDGALIINTAPGGLLPSQATPSNLVAKLKVRIGGLGDAYIPLIL